MFDFIPPRLEYVQRNLDDPALEPLAKCAATPPLPTPTPDFLGI